MITKKQKEIADALVRDLKDIDPEEIRKHIHEENELMKEQEERQRPTREQMEREFTI